MLKITENENKIVSAVIVSAGNSTRMGGVNKQFLELDGAPVIVNTITMFQRCKMIDEIVINKNNVWVSCGVQIPKFVDFLRKNNLSGAEGLIGIPATIGGAIFNNAGAFGYSISDRLLKSYKLRAKRCLAFLYLSFESIRGSEGCTFNDTA